MVQVPPGFPKGSSYQVVWTGIVVAAVFAVAVAVAVAAAVAPIP